MNLQNSKIQQNNSILDSNFSKRKVYIFPNKWGIFYALMVIVIFVLSVNYNLNAAYALTFFMLSFGVLSAFNGCKNLRNLEVVLRNIKPVFLGSEICLEFCISNLENYKKKSIMLEVENYFSEPINISERGNASIKICLPTFKRGRFVINRAKILTNYPFGIFTVWSKLQFQNSAIVYPYPKGEAPFPEPTQDNRSGNLNQANNKEEFYSLRPYQSGDAIKLIAWKNLAKSKELMVKLLQSNNAVSYVFDFEKINGDTEERLSQLCKWINLAENKKYIYTMVLPTKTVSENLDKNHTEKCLQELALYEN